MASFLSDNITNFQATPPVKISGDRNGNLDALTDSFTTGSGAGPAVGDTVDFGPIPKNARITKITLVWEAMSSGAGTAGADVGLSSSGDSARYLSALNMDAAGTKEVGPIIDKLPEQTLTKDEPTFVRLTVTGEAWATSKKCQIVVDYVP